MASPEKLIALATDYENVSKFLPHQMKNIKVIKKDHNETITEEILTFEAIRFQEIIQQTRHTKSKPNETNSEVISGPFKGTKVQTTYEKIDSGTKILVKADLKLSLKYKILGPLIKNKYKIYLTGVLYKMNTAAM